MIPEQATRLIVVLIIVIAALITARKTLIPDDFGEQGHFRTSAGVSLSYPHANVPYTIMPCSRKRLTASR